MEITLEQKIEKIKQIFTSTRVPEVVRYLLRDEAISGKLIIIATVVALILVNSSFHNFYELFWKIPLSIGIGDWSLSQDLRHWVNEGLMTFFFLVVGLEIKREIVQGELGKFQTAVLPIAAAIGGMIVPALLYVALNANSPDSLRGWAIPMATDIAFAIGVLALLGRRIPSALRLFLLTLAIVDDVGAIIVIALFYGSGFDFLMFGLAIVLATMTVILHRKNLLNMPFFIVIGIAMWLAINTTGVHAVITGVILGFLAPIYSRKPTRASLAERLEKFTIPVSTLIAIPLFALANTGVVLSMGKLELPAITVASGILLGLVVGKVVGIVGASWLVVKLGVGKLPDGVRWRQLVGVGLLAGIGFTVSIFITELAFVDNEALRDAAKQSIFIASIMSGILGFMVLRFLSRER